jgi:predicted kinase
MSYGPSKIVVVLRGLPGTGKSTYAEKHYNDAVVCSADSFFVNEEGKYEFDSRKLPQAHQHCLHLFIEAVINGEKVVVIDNTNTCIWEYENYIFLAEKLGYQIQVIRIRFEKSDIPVLEKRNIHNVPIFAIEQMFERFENDAREIIAIYPF